MVFSVDAGMSRDTERETREHRVSFDRNNNTTCWLREVAAVVIVVRAAVVSIVAVVVVEAAPTVVVVAAVVISAAAGGTRERERDYWVRDCKLLVCKDLPITQMVFYLLSVCLIYVCVAAILS